jgi:hypothetical protein
LGINDTIFSEEKKRKPKLKFLLAPKIITTAAATEKSTFRSGQSTREDVNLLHFLLVLVSAFFSFFLLFLTNEILIIHQRECFAGPKERQ